MKNTHKLSLDDIKAACRIMRVLDWLMIKEVVAFYNRINAIKITMTLSGYKHCLRNSDMLLIAAQAAEKSDIHSFIPAFENLFQASRR